MVEVVKVLMHLDECKASEIVIASLKKIIEQQYNNADPFEFNALVDTMLSLTYYGYKVCKSTKVKLN